MTPDKMQIYRSQRPRLLALAYRLLGSRADAEDVLQEAWLRWQDQDLATFDSPEAYLTTIVTRLGIDHLRKENQRSRYVGPWLPEPVEDVEWLQVTGPGDTHERFQSISMAFLVLLERLNPVERAVYLLKEVFGYSYDEISDTVEKTVANCRQIDRRARQQLALDRARYEFNPRQHQQLLTGFIQALALGDIAALQSVLAADVVLTSDGGGKALSVLRPLYGIERIGRFINALRRRHVAEAVNLRLVTLNGGPGLLVLVNEVVATAITFSWQNNQIQNIYLTRNPDKLRHLT